MTGISKNLRELIQEADDFDGPSHNGLGPRSNAVWWDYVVVPLLHRRRRLAMTGHVYVLKSVHDEMRQRDLLAKSVATALGRRPLVVVRRPRSAGPHPLVPTLDELRTAARRLARLAMS